MKDQEPKIPDTAPDLKTIDDLAQSEEDKAPDETTPAEGDKAPDAEGDKTEGEDAGEGDKEGAY